MGTMHPTDPVLNAATFAPGQAVPATYNKGLIAASFFVSLSGSITAIELLHRRHVRRGWRNWLHLLSCAVAMGLVGTWAMHFVANYSIILGSGDSNLQLVYKPGQTAASCFIPVAAMFIAFLIADFQYPGRMQLLLSNVLSGIFMGGAMAGMHYTGNLAVSNYYVTFRHANIAGAIVIACVTSIAALTLLFWLRELWLTRFYYRLACAVILAGAVSSMHWTGTLGSHYVLKTDVPGSPNSRTTNFIIAIALTLLTLPACIAVAVSTSLHRRNIADRAQQVVLAVVHFDQDGRLMVKQDGDLPARKITTEHNDMAFDDQFDTRHPVFHWIYRASSNWNSVERFIPAMRRHLNTSRFTERRSSRFNVLKSSNSSASVDAQESVVNDDYSTLFREAFCVAASNLALELDVNFDEIGVLGDVVLTTGATPFIPTPPQVQGNFIERFRAVTHTATHDTVDASVGLDLFGKGQLLVLGKQCSKRETIKHIADGYRFVPLDRGAALLAKSMQVPSNYITKHLYRMQGQVCAIRPVIPKGTLLGCFAIRPGLSRGSHWDVMVRKDNPDRLPFVQLSNVMLQEDALVVIRQLNGLTVTQCLELLATEAQIDPIIDLEFGTTLYERIKELSAVVDEPFFKHSVFSSSMVKMPTFSRLTGLASTCNLLVFHSIPDVHGASLSPTSLLTYTPFSFFQIRQRCLNGVPHHANFDRKVHHEFGAFLAPAMADHQASIDSGHSSRNSTMSKRSSKWFAARKFKSLNSVAGEAFSPYTTRSSSSSAKGVTKFRKRLSAGEPDHELQVSRNMAISEGPWSGVLITQEVIVSAEARVRGEPSRSPVWPNGSWHGGSEAYAGTADPEIPTFVDELFQITAQRWQSSRK